MEEKLKIKLENITLTLKSSERQKTIFYIYADKQALFYKRSELIFNWQMESKTDS